MPLCPGASCAVDGNSVAE